MKHKTWKILAVSASLLVLAAACNQQKAEQSLEPQATQVPPKNVPPPPPVPTPADINLAVQNALGSIITNVKGVSIDTTALATWYCARLNDKWDWFGPEDEAKCVTELTAQLNTRLTDIQNTAKDIKDGATTAAAAIKSYLESAPVRTKVDKLITALKGILGPYLEEYEPGTVFFAVLEKALEAQGNVQLVRTEIVSKLPGIIDVQLPGYVGDGQLAEFIANLFTTNRGALLDFISGQVTNKCQEYLNNQGGGVQQ